MKIIRINGGDIRLIYFFDQYLNISFYEEYVDDDGYDEIGILEDCPIRLCAERC